MKNIKLFLVAFLFSLVLGLSSCNGCSSEAQNEVAVDSTEVVADSVNVATIDSIQVDSVSKGLGKPLGEWP